MIIKINESSQEFEEIIDTLKYRSGESTNSKAALYAIKNYTDISEKLSAKENELERLKSTMEILQALFRQKNQAEDGIRDILK